MNWSRGPGLKRRPDDESKICILLARLALFCRMMHDFGRCLERYGPKSDSTFSVLLLAPPIKLCIGFGSIAAVGATLVGHSVGHPGGSTATILPSASAPSGHPHRGDEPKGLRVHSPDSRRS